MSEAKKQILLVDDEEYVRKAICRALRKLGVEFIQAESGEKALILLQKQQFDLLITDHKMPGMTGLELISKVKETYPALPVILISGNLQAREAPSGILFTPKPWQDDVLENFVRQSLGKNA
ncbi:MAG: response regulator [Candidatus Parcubacteria bacterium]|nr:response regulator [Candidatus Parcubacteria bacterium]